MPNDMPHYRSPIEAYAPQDMTQYVSRLRKKMNKNKILDLSYSPSLTIFFNHISETDIKNVNHVYLTNVTLNPTDLAVLNEWIQWNPKLLFWCATTDDFINEQLELNLFTLNTLSKWKFISLGTIPAPPTFSPQFFMNLGNTPVDNVPLVMMAGNMPYNYQRILLERLFVALNSDATQETQACLSAKNDIYKLLNNKPIYLDEGIEVFLLQLQTSGISYALYNAAENFIRIMSIRCVVPVQDESPYNGHDKVIDTTPISYEVAYKLHQENIFTQEEWNDFITRYDNNGGRPNICKKC
jgi:hypothetical protein